MITSTFIYTASWIIGAILAFVPSLSPVSAQMSTAFVSLGQYLAMWDALIPLSVLTFCISAALILQLAVFAFKTARWLYTYLPFIGGK